MGKQPSMGQKKSKDAIARAALASRKGTKKKWSKGKTKEKKSYDVFVTPKVMKDIEKEIQKMRMVTPAILGDRFKLVSSVARKVMRHFADNKKILPLDAQSK